MTTPDRNASGDVPSGNPARGCLWIAGMVAVIVFGVGMILIGVTS